MLSLLLIKCIGNVQEWIVGTVVTCLWYKQWFYVTRKVDNAYRPKKSAYDNEPKSPEVLCSRMNVLLFIMRDSKYLRNKVSKIVWNLMIC